MTNVGISFSAISGGARGRSWASGSISGLSIPGITSNILVSSKTQSGIKLGGGFHGIMPQHVGDQEAGSEYPRTRLILRDVWNTTRYSGQNGKENKRVITPFRAVMNAGDVLSRKNYSCGGPNQMTFTCDNSNVPASSTNVKFVSDSSDYIRFRKQQAMNHNYNDSAH